MCVFGGLLSFLLVDSCWQAVHQLVLFVGFYRILSVAETDCGERNK